MKLGQIGPTFLVPEKTVNFFGVKPLVPSSTLKMRKSHKKLAYTLEMKLFCRCIGGLSAGHVSYSLGRLKYIAIYWIHSAGSNIYRNISDAIDFKSNNNIHRSNLSIIFHFYFLLANQLEPPNNISQVIIKQPLSCEHPWREGKLC